MLFRCFDPAGGGGCKEHRLYQAVRLPPQADGALQPFHGKPKGKPVSQVTMFLWALEILPRNYLLKIECRSWFLFIV